MTLQTRRVRYASGQRVPPRTGLRVVARAFSRAFRYEGDGKGFLNSLAQGGEFLCAKAGSAIGSGGFSVARKEGNVLLHHCGHDCFDIGQINQGGGLKGGKSPPPGERDE